MNFFKKLRSIKLSPLWQDIILVVVGFLFLMYAVAKGNDDLILIIFGFTGGIIMALGIIELVYEVVKQVSFTVGSALVKIFNIKIYARRVGYLISMVIRDSKEARGVSLLFLILIFIVGYILGKMF